MGKDGTRPGVGLGSKPVTRDHRLEEPPVLNRLTIILLIGGAVVQAALLAGCGGGSADLPALATEAAGATPSASLQIRARSLKFDKDTLVAPAGSEIVVAIDNQDGGTSHNFAVYTNKDARENLFRGQLFEGKKTVEERFRAPAAGVYYFRCDAHPDMDGVFITR